MAYRSAISKLGSALGTALAGPVLVAAACPNRDFALALATLLVITPWGWSRRC